MKCLVHFGLDLLMECLPPNCHQAITWTYDTADAITETKLQSFGWIISVLKVLIH